MYTLFGFSEFVSVFLNREVMESYNFISEFLVNFRYTASVVDLVWNNVVNNIIELDLHFVCHNFEWIHWKTYLLIYFFPFFHSKVQLVNRSKEDTCFDTKVSKPKAIIKTEFLRNQFLIIMNRNRCTWYKFKNHSHWKITQNYTFIHDIIFWAYIKCSVN